MDKNLNIEFVWKNVPENLKKSVVEFWLKEGAMTKEDDALKRADELLAVCQSDGQIIGVATGIKTMYPALRNNFIVYRSYVTEKHRHAGVASSIFNLVYDTFNDDKTYEKYDVIGILCAFENAHLNQNKFAVWAKNRNLTFIGFDNRGVQLRVAYFEGAQIKLPPLKNQ
ncbi:hypothetical protein [Ekhidna sp.]|uniref:hypothetical protein n=1 Tax=Ekhidna sp. TaxID=2608089 RepID=UPI0032EBAFF3